MYGTKAQFWDNDATYENLSNPIHRSLCNVSGLDCQYIYEFYFKIRSMITHRLLRGNEIGMIFQISKRDTDIIDRCHNQFHFGEVHTVHMRAISTFFLHFFLLLSLSGWMDGGLNR